MLEVWLIFFFQLCHRAKLNRPASFPVNLLDLRRRYHLRHRHRLSFVEHLRQRRLHVAEQLFGAFHQQLEKKMSGLKLETVLIVSDVGKNEYRNKQNSDQIT